MEERYSASEGSDQEDVGGKTGSEVVVTVDKGCSPYFPRKVVASQPLFTSLVAGLERVTAEVK